MGAGTVYEELDEAKTEIENLKANYKIKLELSESLKRSNDEQLIKFQEAVLKIEKLSEEVNEKGALLEEAKVENEKLRENYQVKVEFSESLRRSHSEQLIKNQEVGLKIEKLTQELNEKNEEISLARQKYDEVELNLKEKDNLVKQMTALNDKFQAESKEKNRKCEEENLRLGLALDEANEKNMQQEQLIKSLQFSENLRRAHQEQLSKNQEVGLKIEKLSQELHEKNEEIFLTRQKYEELDLKLKEKHALVKHVSALNDKLRVETNEKIAKCEEENLRLGLALEEASANNMQQEEQLQSFQEEIQRFKGLASVSKNSYSEARSKSFKEERLRDDVLHKVEEEMSKYENQLKWKKEQFNHLQEAHEKLRSDLKVREREWETEKASLLDELSDLQTKLDSQIRLSESLKSRLEMCNNALSHAESKRKILEAELSESRKYEEAKSIIENLTGERDIEIAGLRCSLGEKENLYKEMESQVRMLEQEKKDLLSSLKELQEAQIHGEGHSSSFTKLRNKTKGLEHVHKDCSERHKSEVSDWNSQIENISGELNSCNAELDSKIQLINKLKQEAKTRDSVIIELAMNNEEAAIMLLVLKSELSDAILKFVDAYAADLAQNGEEHKERVSLLIKLLDAQKIAVTEAQKQVEVERMKVAELTRMIASANSTEAQKQVEVERMKVAELTGMIASANSTDAQKQVEVERMKVAELTGMIASANSTEAQKQVEVERMKVAELTGMIASANSTEVQELNAFQYELKKHNNTVENMLNESRTALQRTNEELDVNFCEATELDFELQVWKSIAQQLKLKLEEEHRNRRKEVKAATQSQMLRLKTHVKKLRCAMDKANEELAEKFCEGNEVEFQLQIWKSIAEQLKIKLEENHHLRREVEASLLAQTGLELSLKQEKDNLSTLIEEKDNKIKSLEQELILLSEELEEAILAQLDAEKNYEHELSLKQEKDNLSTLIEEKDNKIKSLEQELILLSEELEGAILAQVDAEKNYEHELSLKQEKDNLSTLIEEKDNKIKCLEQELILLSEELEGAILAQVDAEKNYEHELSLKQEKDNLSTLIEEKDNKIKSLEQELILLSEELEGAILAQVDAEKNYEHEKEILQQQVADRDQEFESSISISAKMIEMQQEMDALHEAWEEVAASVLVKDKEIQEKNLIVNEMETVQQQVDERDQKFENLQQTVRSLEQEFESSTVSFSSKLSQMQLEMNSFHQAWDEVATTVIMKEMEIQEKNLIVIEMESMLKLSSERLNQLCHEDFNLSERLECIMQAFDDEDSTKENRNMAASPLSSSKADAILDQRLPFRAINS